MAYDRGEIDVRAKVEVRLNGVTPPLGFEPPEGWGAR